MKKNLNNNSEVQIPFTVYLDASTVGMSDVMEYLDAHGFPAEYEFLQIVNCNRTNGLLISKYPYSYKESALSNRIEKGKINPWESKYYPGWQEYFDSNLVLWTLIKDKQNMYSVSVINGYHMLVGFGHCILFSTL